MTGTIGTTTVRKSYVDLSHGQAHLRIAGDPAGVPVLLLHQVPSSSAMFSALLGPLAERGHYAVAMDMPGYGETTPVVPEAGSAELTDYARAATEVLDALGLGTVHWFGHHTGASVSMTAAAYHPERVRSIATWGIPVLSPAFSRELAAEPPPEYTMDFVGDVTGWWDNRRKHSVLAPVMVRSLMEMLQCGIHRPDGHNAVGRTDHGPILDRIAVPFLGLTGDREMLDGETRSVVTERPGLVEFLSLGAVGMDVADEAPELLADTLSAFFARVDS